MLRSTSIALALGLLAVACGSPTSSLPAQSSPVASSTPGQSVAPSDAPASSDASPAPPSIAAEDPAVVAAKETIESADLANVATIDAIGGLVTYAHEFGHLLGLHDAYHDVVNPQTGKTESIPYPDAPRDLMSTGIALISQETIDRVVKRNLPNMKDTSGKSVTDGDIACDYQGEWAGKRLVGFIKYCGGVEHPYWGADIKASNGDKAFVSYLIPEGSDQAPAELTVPFVEPDFDALIAGTGTFVEPADPNAPAHFIVQNAEGTYIITLEQGKFCTPPP